MDIKKRSAAQKRQAKIREDVADALAVAICKEIGKAENTLRAEYKKDAKQNKGKHEKETENDYVSLAFASTPFSRVVTEALSISAENSDPAIGYCIVAKELFDEGEEASSNLCIIKSALGID